MRKFVVSIFSAVLFVGVTSFAGTIAQDMMAAARLAKQIKNSVSDVSANEQNANNAAQMAAYFNDTINQVPSAIYDLPQDQQQAAFQGYQSYIQAVVNVSLQMQQAFLNNDNQTAANLLQQLFQLEDEGHSHYNP